MKMDFSESTKILFNRIQEVEPENVIKIIGYLLLQDHGDLELSRLVSAPEHLLHQVILNAKTHLQNLACTSRHPQQQQLSSSPPLSSPSSLNPKTPPYSRPFHSSPWDSSPTIELQNPPQFLGLDESFLTSEGFYPNRRSFSSGQPPEFPVKICHYYNKGFCKHGSSCRYFHGQVVPEGGGFHGGGDLFGDDPQLGAFSPGSLEKLEFEIIELLKSRRGNPISIASLPAMYFEKYGKYLQAEGYLTESQRHGKAGYSLTKLLARLKNSIRLIDRPHGQHAVILAEDAMKYVESRGDKSDPGPIVNGSRQIYLTFPAESTFTEEDVSNYFETFGPVEDVRIPCQQKRMFGFVTFASSDTVKVILAKGNPHFVCGARVLVKPYREKSKLIDRKYSDRFDGQGYYSPQYSEAEAEFHAVARSYESRMLRKQIMEQHERALELETRRLSEIQLSNNINNNNQPFFGYSMNDFGVSEDFQSTEQFSRLLNALNCASSSEANYTDQESQVVNLPDSPFSASIATGISTVI